MVGPACIPLVEYAITMVSGPTKPPTFKQKLETFYKENAPEKLQEPKFISKLMAKYRGRERLLFKTLHEKYPPQSFDFRKAYEDLKESATDFVSDAPKEPKNLVLLLLIGVFFFVVVQWSFQALFSSFSKPKRRRSKKSKTKVAVEEVEEVEEEDDENEKDD
eukprot:3597933-Pyramimonas_sp.AAC.4